jgi:hypothetical protein
LVQLNLGKDNVRDEEGDDDADSGPEEEVDYQGISRKRQPGNI